MYNFVLEHRKHAQELIKTYDLSEIDGIVISSGDGMYNCVRALTIYV